MRSIGRKNTKFESESAEEPVIVSKSMKRSVNHPLKHFNEDDGSTPGIGAMKKQEVVLPRIIRKKSIENINVNV